MRMLPFFKPKKGFMMAGGGLETSSGGGGGGGGGGAYAISTTETKTNFTYMGDDVYCKAYNIDISATLGSGSTTFTSGETQIKKLLDSSLSLESKIGNVYAHEVIKGFIKVTPNYGEIMWVGTSAYNISDWQNGVLILYYTKNS